MSLAELIEYFQSWADSFDAPVETGCLAGSLEVDNGGFVVSMPSKKLKARTVVVANGAFQAPYRPKSAESMPQGVTQIFAEEYDNPDSLPPGAVLIVGSGQTGCQLAEELRDAGRKVFLACGRGRWTPRRIGDRDFLVSAVRAGCLARPVGELPP